MRYIINGKTRLLFHASKICFTTQKDINQMLNLNFDPHC